MTQKINIALNRFIEITPDTRGGKPRIAGRRITVTDIAIAYLRLGQSLEEIVVEYDLTLGQTHTQFGQRENRGFRDRKNPEAQFNSQQGRILRCLLRIK